MNKNIHSFDTCEVIQDLMPGYLEGSCSDTSRTLVEEHMNTCPDCEEMLEQMKKDNKNENEKEAGQKIDLLKTTRKKNRRKTAGIVIAVLVIIALIFGIWKVVRPVPFSASKISWYFPKSDVISLHITNPDYGFSGNIKWSTEEDGTLLKGSVSVKDASWLTEPDITGESIPVTDQTKTVMLEDYILIEDGSTIERAVSILWENRAYAFTGSVMASMLGYNQDAFEVRTDIDTNSDHSVMTIVCLEGIAASPEVLNLAAREYLYGILAIYPDIDEVILKGETSSGWHSLVLNRNDVLKDGEKTGLSASSASELQAIIQNARSGKLGGAAED